MLLASLWALAACGDARGTSVRLLITADPEVRARAEAVRLEVTAGHSPATRTLDETLALAGRDWPLQAVIVPLHGDATRHLEVVLEALDARGRAVARIRAAPAFEAERARDVALHFEAACLDVVQCGAGTTCAGGRCAPLPSDEAPDAGVARDAGPSDAGPRDAGPPCEERPTYADRDGDGYGDPAAVVLECRPSGGRVSRAGDCDDACSACAPGGRETCDGARDEDCDERVDEGCECTLGTTRECRGGRRVCIAGVQTCLGSRWSECAGRVEAREESCNAVDDDCDARVDEDLEVGCGHGCHSRCVLGAWGPCRDAHGLCEPDDDEDERDDDD